MNEYPLTKANRIQLACAFRMVPQVDLSIDCVIEAQMGKAFVDSVAQPTAFQIQTGPFIYFAGEVNTPGGQEMLKNLPAHSLIMPSTPVWLEALQDLYGNNLQSIQRYSFVSDDLSQEHLRALAKQTQFISKVQVMDLTFTTGLWGQEHFIDLTAYDSPEDFVQRGIGVHISCDSKILGAAFASLVCSRGIEVSIYVIDKYRRMGMATALACRLLLWCLENNMEPHWDAANIESARLALKLGYQPAGRYLAYYLAQ